MVPPKPDSFQPLVHWRVFSLRLPSTKGSPMNRVFRVVWSKALNLWVVASELGPRQGKAGRSRENVEAMPMPFARIAGAWPLRAAMLAALFASSSPTWAADRYWDPNGTALGRGGVGTWNLTGNFWSPSNDGTSGPYSAWNNTTFDHAIFGGTVGTVTLGAPVTVGGLTFETTGYVLSGNILTLAGITPTVTTNPSVAVTINSVLAGTAGLSKAGTGALTLTGANSFSGDVFLNAGTLALSGDAALGAAANRVVTTGGSTLTSTGALNAGRVIELGSGRTTLTGAGVGSAHFTGVGGLAAVAGVTLNNDANDFTGQAAFFVNGSAYFTSVRNEGEASSLGAGSGANGTILVTAQNQYSDWARYIGTGNSSNRNWQFAYSGATPQAGLSNDGSGTLTLTGDLASPGTSSAGMVFAAQSADLELLGVISSGSTRTHTYTDGGTTRSITLGGANTYSGTTSIATVTEIGRAHV